jgi:hypothetical protein
VLVDAPADPDVEALPPPVPERPALPADPPPVEESSPPQWATPRAKEKRRTAKLGLFMGGPYFSSRKPPRVSAFYVRFDPAVGKALA